MCGTRAFWVPVRSQSGRLSGRAETARLSACRKVTCEVDHSASPLAVSIAVSGPEQPGDPDTLAALLSDQEGEDVAVSIRYTQLITGNQPNY